MFDRDEALEKLREYEKPITWVNAAVLLTLIVFGYSQLAEGSAVLGLLALAVGGAVLWFDQNRLKWTTGFKPVREPLTRGMVLQVVVSLSVAAAFVYVVMAGS